MHSQRNLVKETQHKWRKWLWWKGEGCPEEVNRVPVDTSQQWKWKDKIFEVNSNLERNMAIFSEI
jgi:hypothetical protein